MSQFIVFEGLDGAGTTTQSQLLVESKPNECFWDKEPSDGKYGLKIRQILKGETKESPENLLDLFIKDRKEHQYLIKNKLNQNLNFILDRYLISTLAYQGLKFPLENLYEMNKDFKVPDIVFFLDVPVKVCINRLAEEKELFEEKNILTNVRKNYLKAIDLLLKKKWNIILLNGENNIKTLHDEIKQHLREW